MITVLFNVDGTLCRHSGALAAHAIADAITAYTGLPDPFSWVDHTAMLNGHNMSTYPTDAAIILEALSATGAYPDPFPDADVAAHLIALGPLAAKAYATRLADGQSAGEILPGVPELIAALTLKSATLGLLTANLEAICEFKLTSLGLMHHFSFGAFGDSSLVRSDLFATARAKAHSLGLSTQHLVYVGDAPRDIAAAHAVDVPILATASGRYSLADLTGADIVVPDLTDTDLALHALLTLAHHHPPHLATTHYFTPKSPPELLTPAHCS